MRSHRDSAIRQHASCLTGAFAIGGARIHHPLDAKLQRVALQPPWLVQLQPAFGRLSLSTSLLPQAPFMPNAAAPLLPNSSIVRSRRLARCYVIGPRAFAAQRTKAPRELIIVSSSAPMRWSPFPGRHIPLWCELASLLRVKDVLYENPMTMRRSALVAQFDGAEDTGKGPRGTYVSIDQTPFHVPMAFADHPSRGARARQVLKLLGDTERERKRIAMENAKVRTGLWGPRRHVDRAPPPPRLHADDGEHPCCPRLPSAAHSGSRAFRGARGRGRR